jgi:putative membrane protein
MVKSLLSEADAREVEAAVAHVESKCSAELVVAVVPRSDDYWRARVLLSVAWGLAAAFAFLHLEPWREPGIALGLQLLVGVLVYALSGWPPLLRALVSRAATERASSARAFQLFAERGLYATRGRTALLLFVSELEHRVILLGDHAIHERLGQAGWDNYVGVLAQHLKQGQAKAGILRVLEQLEPQLIEVAPPLSDDVNELPNAVLRS